MSLCIPLPSFCLPCIKLHKSLHEPHHLPCHEENGNGAAKGTQHILQSKGVMRKEEDRRDGPAGHVAFSKTHAHPSQSTRSRRPLTPLAFDQAHVSQVCIRARNDYVDCESQKARGSLVHGMLARTALTEILSFLLMLPSTCECSHAMNIPTGIGTTSS